MEAKKFLYCATCAGGFAVAFVGLRILSNALLGIGGILVCIYGLLEAMHLFSSSPKKSSAVMYSVSNTCPHCGAEIPEDNDFCGKCGNKIA